MKERHREGLICLLFESAHHLYIIGIQRRGGFAPDEGKMILGLTMHIML